jgi:DNA repair exonuclease SbcCD nuclease subunit
MFRFIHSADWQLGARFSQFGTKAGRLREARLTTLKRALDLARERGTDAFLVAGDLFEDNQVEESLVVAVVDLFASYPSIPIYLLPGNHDPFSGPDSVWQRKPFLRAPGNIHVITQPGTTDLGGAWLIASPLEQKISTIDPSLRLVDLAAKLPPDSIKIGLTHGALAIEGKHQPNDFPIALNAATRAGLDYLAIGHWHNWLPDTDQGRLVMPGTPEPDRFDHERCGQVALVEITGAGHPPNTQPLPVATLTWSALSFDFLSEASSRLTLGQELASLSSNAANTVVRVTLTGTASPKQQADVRSWLDTLLAPFLVNQVTDRTLVALTSEELGALRSEHPILAQVLADIGQLEILATGRVSSVPIPDGIEPLSLSEAQALLAPAKIELPKLTAEHLAQARQVLLLMMQEVAP